MASSKGRTAAGLLAGALVALGAAGCRTANTSAPPAQSSAGTPSSQPTKPDTINAPGPAAPAEAGGVACAGARCSVTLDPAHATVQVVGTTVTLRNLGGGQAMLAVGTHTVPCVQGQTVVAGPYALTCSNVGGNRVSLVIARS